MRKQNGQIVRIGNRWCVRYWEHQNIGGAIERKRVTHPLSEVTTRGRKPPADIEEEAATYMATMVNNCSIPPERTISFAAFVTGIYLPGVKEAKKPSTQQGYNDVWEHHLKTVHRHELTVPTPEKVKLKEVRTYTIQHGLTRSGRKTCRGIA